MMNIFTIDRFLVWVSKFSPSKILDTICNQGVKLWNKFRMWFFGINFDAHEWALDMFMPLMPAATERMERRVADEMVAEVESEKLEDCLEIDECVQEYYNEDVNRVDEKGVVTTDKKAQRRQIKKIKNGCVEKAIRCVTRRIRNRHMIYGDDMGKIDEAAVRATANDICGEFRINETHTTVLVYSASYLALTPDQKSIDAVKLAYNPKSKARRTLVSTLRESTSWPCFKGLEDF